MSTDEAFKVILNDPYLWSKTGLSQSRRHYFRHMFRKKKSISLEKKLDLLQKAGIDFEIKFLFKPDFVSLK